MDIYSTSVVLFGSTLGLLLRILIQNNLKVNIDSHYDFLKDDPDYGIYLKISNIN